MDKICSKCKLSKDKTQFSTNPTKRDGLNYVCKKCQNDYFKVWYRTHNKKVKQSILQWKKKNRKHVEQMVVEYLEAHPCVDCGERDIIVLEFDHVRGTKKHTISQMVCGTGGFSWKSIKEEINKCDVRCANCHGRKTAHQLGFWITRYKPTGGRRRSYTP